ncbi:MAG TPA: alpha/beta hydrolase [Vicinamibacterales bacterium]|nr:alpha/beta hydrolase [Vicinamibacterales bacterium]
MNATLDSATGTLLAQMAAGGGKPLYEMTVDEVRAVVNGSSEILGGMPAEVASVAERTVPVSGGAIRLRVYTPPGTAATFPVIVGFHGGGFVAGGIDTYDRTARFLCRHAEAVVINVGYRLAPEHLFPAAVEDAYAAVMWAAQHAREFKGDPTRLAITGDSAGGNLAAVVCLLSKARGGPRIAYQALFYPLTDFTLKMTPSRVQFGDGQYFLSNRDSEWFRQLYLANADQARDPRVSPLLASDLHGLPPALVVAAGCDPLLDEGKAYADRLSAAGVTVDYRCYDGTIHAFTAFSGAIPAGEEALSYAAGKLKQALA